MFFSSTLNARAVIVICGLRRLDLPPFTVLHRGNIEAAFPYTGRRSHLANS